MQATTLRTPQVRLGRAGRIRTVVGYRLQFCRLTPSTARPLHEKLVPPRRIERHPPVLQTGAQTTYAREALLIDGIPRENLTPTKRFGGSSATATLAGLCIEDVLR